MITLTATFIPGSVGPGTDFTCATCWYHLGGEPTGYASDTICTLIDSFGLSFERAERKVYRLWDLAQATPGTPATLLISTTTERN